MLRLRPDDQNTVLQCGGHLTEPRSGVVPDPLAAKVF